MQNKIVYLYNFNRDLLMKIYNEYNKSNIILSLFMHLSVSVKLNYSILNNIVIVISIIYIIKYNILLSIIIIYKYVKVNELEAKKQIRVGFV